MDDIAEQEYDMALRALEDALAALHPRCDPMGIVRSRLAVVPAYLSEVRP